mmetsp:Transcript_884/g.2502  ORF Transcript_884/g.2502 Transcript_884/m.2502 type:complete len:224 (-) Transcript_884:370-1041(-)
MLTCGTDCRPCVGATVSPATTVAAKVGRTDYNKEKENFATELREAREKKAREEEQRKREERRRVEARRAMEEAVRKQEEELRLWEEQQRIEAEKRRQEELRVEELRRLERERLAEEARQFMMAQERKRVAGEKRLAEFLAFHQFENVNEKKTKWLKTTFPLHVAVEENDGEVVRLLVEAGADTSVVNSARQTPMQMAQKKARHLGISRVFDEVLFALQKKPDS